ncbi:hypothetical protein AAY473_010579 [Plecturocebus cupreus]
MPPHSLCVYLPILYPHYSLTSPPRAEPSADGLWRSLPCTISKNHKKKGPQSSPLSRLEYSGIIMTHCSLDLPMLRQEYSDGVPVISLGLKRPYKLPLSPVHLQLPCEHAELAGWRMSDHVEQSQVIQLRPSQSSQLSDTPSANQKSHEQAQLKSSKLNSDLQNYPANRETYQ